jgi:hypothetical protein
VLGGACSRDRPAPAAAAVCPPRRNLPTCCVATAQGDGAALGAEQILGASQEELEGSVPLVLVGLVVMANSLRPDSTSVIQQLQAAQIRCAPPPHTHTRTCLPPRQQPPTSKACHLPPTRPPTRRCAMVTGDHLRTAISVAHQCGILPPNRPICLIDGAEHNSSEPAFKVRGSSSAPPTTAHRHPPTPALLWRALSATPARARGVTAPGAAGAAAGQRAQCGRHCERGRVQGRRAAQGAAGRLRGGGDGQGLQPHAGHAGPRCGAGARGVRRQLWAAAAVAASRPPPPRACWPAGAGWAGLGWKGPFSVRARGLLPTSSAGACAHTHLRLESAGDAPPPQPKKPACPS